MKRKISILLVLCSMFLSIFSTVSASEPIQLNLEENANEFFIVDERTLYNESEDAYYTFGSEEEMNEFLMILDGSYTASLYACGPGDPGYPHCQEDPVTSVGSKLISSEKTGYILSENYLLGNNGWCYGPGSYTIEKNSSYDASFGISYKGFSASLGFQVSASQSYTFSVKGKEKGNVKYKSRFIIETRQYVYTLKSGKKVNGSKYKVTRRMDGTGGFTGIIIKL